LLKAAVRLIAEVGPTAFTLREVARRAGVSHNAPYRHFRSKDDVIAAVASQGFQELTEAMLAAAEPAQDALDRLKRSGLAYVAFALRRPEHFAVMVDAALSPSNHPQLAATGDRAFETLVNFVKACQAEQQLPGGAPMEYALFAWSLVHGVAKLAVSGRLPQQSRTDILKFAEFAMDRSFPGHPHQD
jgi:AcrR family transcriptional regulator